MERLMIDFWDSIMFIFSANDSWSESGGMQMFMFAISDGLISTTLNPWVYRSFSIWKWADLKKKDA